jgi:hypothetical protein
MSVERVLPKTIDYTDVLPLAVESKSRRRTFFPTNGATFNSNGNNIIRIDISADALLDTQHSYLKFDVEMSDAAGAITSGVDTAGGHAFFSRLRVEQSGTILEDIQQYNRLMGAVVLPCQESSDANSIRSMTEAQYAAGQVHTGAAGQGNNDTTIAISVAGAGAGAGGADGIGGMLSATGNCVAGIDQFPNGAVMTFCIPLTSGLLNCEKLIPLMLMSAPLTIELELGDALSTTVASAAGNRVQLRDVRYIANLVEVGSEVSQQLRMLQEMSGGVLTLTGQTFRHFGANLAAGVSNTINVPARVKSMKSIFFNCRGTAADAQGSVDIGSGTTQEITDYQFKIGSVVYPPTPVNGPGATATATLRKGEALMELEKAWGNVGSRLGMGKFTKNNNFYINSRLRPAALGAAGVPADANRPAYAPFGLDMEAFQRVAIESGVNTADRALPISLILNHGGVAGGAQAGPIDVYVLADALFYINADGSMSVSV